MRLIGMGGKPLYASEIDFGERATDALTSEIFIEGEVCLAVPVLLGGFFVCRIG